LIYPLIPRSGLVRVSKDEMGSLASSFETPALPAPQDEEAA
jgi:hypothetical protein